MIIELKEKDNLLSTIVTKEDKIVLGNDQEIWCLLEETQNGFQFFDLGTPEGIKQKNKTVYEGFLTEDESFFIGEREYRIVSYVNDLRNFFEFSTSGLMVAAVYYKGQYEQLYINGGINGLFQITKGKIQFSNKSVVPVLEQEIALNDDYTLILFNIKDVNTALIKERLRSPHFALALLTLIGVVTLPFLQGPKEELVTEDFYRDKQKILEVKKEIVRPEPIKLPEPLPEPVKPPEAPKVQKIVKQAPKPQPQVAVAKPVSSFSKLLSVAAVTTTVAKQANASIPRDNASPGLAKGLGVKVSKATQVADIGGSPGNTLNLAKGVSVGSKGSNSALLSLDGESYVEGGLDRDIVAQVIAKNINQIRNCYEAGLIQNQGIAGKVKMDFTIDGSGTVQSSSVANSTLGNDYVHNCMVNAIKAWKFPNPKLGRPVRVVYPFLLRKVN